MKYDVFIRAAAEADMDKARAWYERQRAGLGREFIDCVEKTTEKLRDWPDLGIPVHRRLQRTLLRAQIERFPYGVFYIVDGSRIVVVGVIHERRAPRVWKRRLG